MWRWLQSAVDGVRNGIQAVARAVGHEAVVGVVGAIAGGLIGFLAGGPFMAITIPVCAITLGGISAMVAYGVRLNQQNQNAQLMAAQVAAHAGAINVVNNQIANHAQVIVQQQQAAGQRDAEQAAQIDQLQDQIAQNDRAQNNVQALEIEQLPVNNRQEIRRRGNQPGVDPMQQGRHHRAQGAFRQVLRRNNHGFARLPQDDDVLRLG